MKKLFFFLFIYLNLATKTFAQIGLTRPTTDDRGFIIANKSSTNLEKLVPNVITLFFTIGGLGFIIMMLWGAVSWILSGGDKEQIAAARKRITTAITGLVLLSLTFIIMVVVGQILGLRSLNTFDFKIPGLLESK